MGDPNRPSRCKKRAARAAGIGAATLASRRHRPTASGFAAPLRPPSTCAGHGALAAGGGGVATRNSHLPTDCKQNRGKVAGTASRAIVKAIQNPNNEFISKATLKSVALAHLSFDGLKHYDHRQIFTYMKTLMTEANISVGFETWKSFFGKHLRPSWDGNHKDLHSAAGSA